MSKARAKSKAMLIDDPRQIRALVSPIRQEIVDALEAAGPCSIAELATQLGRPADGLYFHIRRLLKVGLLAEGVERRGVRRPAATYDVAGRPIRIRDRRENTAATRPVLHAALRLGARDLTRVMGTADAITAGPRRNLTGGRVKGWLSRSELARANRALDKLLDLLRSGRPGRGRRLQTFAWALAPARPQRPVGNSKNGESR